MYYESAVYETSKHLCFSHSFGGLASFEYQSVAFPTRFFYAQLVNGYKAVVRLLDMV